MEAKYEVRKEQLLDECAVAPEVFDRVMPRLERFMEPFVKSLIRREQVEHAHMFVQGLLSDLDHKNIESIAYRFGQERMPLQWFMGVSGWENQPLRDQLVRQVAQRLGGDDGVIVFDPSAFPKSGRESVGVARQWCGRLGKVANCQVAVFMGYVSSREHALVDTRLYLPKTWTRDKERCEKAGVPKERRRHRTRHQLCLEMLAEYGETLPHGWIAGDDELGRPYAFHRRLDRLGERYLLAVPSNTLIRDLDVPAPPYGGRGRRPTRPWQRVDAWAASRDEDEWTEIDVRDGTKGPLGRRSHQAACRGAHAPSPGRPRRNARNCPIPRSRQHQSGQDGLLPVERLGGYVAGGFHSRGQSGTSHRRVHSTQQERSRACRLRGSQLERLVSSSDAFAHRNVVPRDGSPSGEKSGRLQLPFLKSAKAFRQSCIAFADAVPPAASNTSENDALCETNLLASTIGNNVTDCRH